MKLKVFQLKNPVALQLGMVGSHFMINFRTKAQVELGPIKVDNVYLDVINIDQYNMIIGTPFMWMHAFVLDFGQNIINIHGHIIHPLSSSQEDLMIEKRQPLCLCQPLRPTVSASL